VTTSGNSSLEKTMFKLSIPFGLFFLTESLSVVSAMETESVTEAAEVADPVCAKTDADKNKSKKVKGTKAEKPLAKKILINLPLRFMNCRKSSYSKQSKN